MAETVNMPKLGFDMAEGIIVRWVKKEGDKITKGDVLAEIETDKAMVEVESPYSGVVAKHLVAQSTSVPVGDPIALITAEGETLKEEKPEGKPSAPDVVPEKPASSAKASVSEAVPTPAAPPLKPATGEAAPAKTAAAVQPEKTKETTDATVSSESAQAASPLARRMARDYSIDLGAVEGTGPNGRIVRRDVEEAFAKSTTPRLIAESPGTGSPTTGQVVQRLKE